MLQGQHQAGRGGLPNENGHQSPDGRLEVTSCLFTELVFSARSVLPSLF